jgi:hypothetical protein
MSTVNYTPLLGLALPTTGDLSGTWGYEVNNAITSLTDSSIAGAVTLSADADVTLTSTNGATNQARNAILLWTAGGSVTRTITAPAKSKVYVVINATSGSQSIQLVGTGPTTGITVVAGEKCVAAWNGSDFVKVASSVVDGVATISFGTTGLTPNTPTAGAVTVAGTLNVPNGGTAISSYTAGDTLYASGTTTISKLPIGTSTYLMTSSGTAPQWTNPTSVSVGSAAVATNIASGTANEIVYQSAPGTTAFIPAPVTAGYVLSWNGATFTWASAPAATSAINIAGGTAGAVPYQTSPGATSFSATGTAGYLLTSGGTGAPTWTNPATLSVASATTATTATNLAGGAASQIPYQTASGTTAFIPNGTAGQVLVSNGASAPSWQTQVPAVSAPFVYFCANF